MQFTRNLKHIFAIWAITLTLIFGVVRLFGADFLVPITHFFIYRETGIQSKLYTYDFKPSKDIAIIKIDDASLNAYQVQRNLKILTIPKARYGNLVTLLEVAGVKGIAFDIIFQNVDPGEESFIALLERYKNISIASSYDPSVKSSVCVKTNSGTYDDCEGVPRVSYKNVPWGLINHSQFGDRRVFSYDISSETYASWKDSPIIYTLALSLLKSSNPDISFGEITPGREYLIPYFGGPEAYRFSTFSFNDVLSMSPLELENSFKEKYVFIGEGGSILHDQVNSPVTGTMMDGVDSHAHLLNGLLQKRTLADISIATPTLLIILLLLSFFCIVLYLFLPKFASPLLAIISLIFTVFLCRYLYFQHALVIEIFPVLLAVGIFSFPITFIYRFFIIDREKRMITSAFAHYVDPTLVGEIAEKSGEINLGGESRELSILFSDIAGFTTISEKLAPMDLFSLMSSYLTRMTGILTSHGGTLDKYIGDAVMGFFGAPLTLADHAKRACATALAMREALPEFNTEITARGLEAVDFRVGIASGEVMVGNIGSYDRFNYTVLGDTVNLASRLEATSKEYGTRIIVAEPTYLAAKDDYIFRALDKVAVKGKTEGVMIYELIAKNSEMPLPLVVGVGGGIDSTKYTRYEEALGLYFEGKYLEAGQLFEKNMADDAPSRVMAMRCVDILKGVVTVEGGVYKMTHK